MEGDKIKQLKKGVNVFLKLSKKTLSGKGVSSYVSIMTFNDNTKKYEQDGSSWIPLNEIRKIKYFDTGGQTFLGSAIISAVKEMEVQLENYRKSQVTARHPTFILFTDGIPVGEDPSKFDLAIMKIKKYSYDWNIITIACGVDDTQYMKKLSSMNTYFNNREVVYAKNAKEIVKCLRFVSSTFDTMQMLNENVDISDSF